MHARERSLAHKFRGRPFAVLGVNVDLDPQRLSGLQQTERMTWRSVVDAPENAIAVGWGVGGLPTVYLIDPKGLIRFESAGAPDPELLEKAIEQLLAEAGS
jgi:hypothetical protein